MRESVRVGIVGTGLMSRVHSSAVLANNGTVVGFVGSSTASAEAAAGPIPTARGYGTVADLVDAGIELLHICTPNDLHAELAAKALDAGVHVICEKPLATSIEDAYRITWHAAGLQRIAAVPFVYRYHGSVRMVRESIRSDGGRGPWLLHGSYLQDWLGLSTTTNWRVDPKRGGTTRAFGDIGIHWFDLMEHVTGQRVIAVSALFGNAFERNGGISTNRTEDGAVVTFRTDRGSIGSLAVSQASAGRKNRLWFSFDGADRSYSFDQEQPETHWVGAVDENRIVFRDPRRSALSDTATSRALPVGHPQGYQHCFNDFVGDVFDAVRGGRRDVFPSFADGLRAAEITAAVIRSVDEDGAWTDVLAADDLLSPITERTGVSK